MHHDQTSFTTCQQSDGTSFGVRFCCHRSRLVNQNRCLLPSSEADDDAGFRSHCLDIFTPFPAACRWSKWPLYSSQVNDGRNFKGSLAVISCPGISIAAFIGGDAKYTIDNRAADSFTTARCSTLRNRPFVQALPTMGQNPMVQVRGSNKYVSKAIKTAKLSTLEAQLDPKYLISALENILLGFFRESEQHANIHPVQSVVIVFLLPLRIRCRQREKTVTYGT